MSNGRRHRRASAPVEVMELNSGDSVVEEQKLVPIFRIDGVSYDLWVNPPATVGLKYLKRVRMDGGESAAQWLMEEMIGEDGYLALMEFDALTKQQLDRILDLCKEHAMGNQEESPAGNG